MATGFSQICKLLFAGLLLCLVTTKAYSQEYSSFRLLGSSISSSGYVTSLAFNTDPDQISISYLNVAGLSSVFTVKLESASAIPGALSVFLPDAGFTETPMLPLDLSQIQLFTGRIVDSGGNLPPPHWFRITKSNDQWSGAFRLGNRLYTLNRFADPDTILVRQLPADLPALATRSIKVSAVIDDEYLESGGAGAARLAGIPAQLPALESIHILDGILTDQLGTTIQLEQLIYQPSALLTNHSADPLTAATRWLDENSIAFGLADNLATLFFRAAAIQTQNSADHPRAGQTAGNVVSLQSSSNYQLATAHHLGELLGLPTQANTLQDWQTQGAEALPNAHWSEQQKAYFAANPTAPELTRVISYDAPEVAVTQEPNDEVDLQLVLAELPESNGLISDDDSTPANTDNNAGAGDPTLLILCAWLLFRHRRRQ